MPNTTNGYRYPAQSDPVAQGATAIQNLAQDVDSLLGVAARGKATITFSNVASANVAVTFPAGRFTAPPNAIASATGPASTQYIGVVFSTTATGATVSARQYQNTPVTTTVDVAWWAFNV